MQRESRKLEYVFRKSAHIGLALFLFVVMGAGCAGTHRTTKTTTTVTSSVEEGNKGYLKKTTTAAASNDQQNNPVTQKSETTTSTVTDTKTEHHSILGSTLHAIGWVIALPFRFVGGLIGLIF